MAVPRNALLILPSFHVCPACLAHSPQKAAYPFLNQGFEFTQARQKTWSGLGVARCASIQALFKPGGFHECAACTSALLGRPRRSGFLRAACLATLLKLNPAQALQRTDRSSSSTSANARAGVNPSHSAPTDARSITVGVKLTRRAIGIRAKWALP